MRLERHRFQSECGGGGGAQAAAEAGAQVHVRGRLSRRRDGGKGAFSSSLGDGLDPPWEPGGGAGAP